MNWCQVPQSELARRLSIESSRDIKRDKASERLTWALIGWVLGVVMSCIVTALARASV